MVTVCGKTSGKTSCQTQKLYMVVSFQTQRDVQMVLKFASGIIWGTMLCLRSFCNPLIDLFFSLNTKSTLRSINTRCRNQRRRLNAVGKPPKTPRRSKPKQQPNSMLSTISCKPARESRQQQDILVSRQVMWVL